MLVPGDYLLILLNYILNPAALLTPQFTSWPSSLWIIVHFSSSADMFNSRRILCSMFLIRFSFQPSGTPGASNYLLAIFFMNLTIYGIYYCAMKQINGEKINKIPLVRFSIHIGSNLGGQYLIRDMNDLNQVYACLGLICFVPSLYFFTKVIFWQMFVLFLQFSFLHGCCQTSKMKYCSVNHLFRQKL